MVPYLSDAIAVRGMGLVMVEVKQGTECVGWEGFYPPKH